jgi:hypothetical protein
MCINHLNLVSVLTDFCTIYSNGSIIEKKQFPADEESETEKENKGKEKAGEEEKFFARTHYIIVGQFQLSDLDKFICFNTSLSVNPYQEDDIQPPKAV